MPVHFFRVGKGARLQMNNINLLLVDGNVVEQPGDLDGTTAQSGLCEEGDVGIGVVHVQVNVLWNRAQNCFDNSVTPGVYGDGANSGPGCQYKLYLNVNDTTFWGFSRVKIINVGNRLAVRNLLAVPLSFRSQGTYFRPTG